MEHTIKNQNYGDFLKKRITFANEVIESIITFDSSSFAFTMSFRAKISLQNNVIKVAELSRQEEADHLRKKQREVPAQQGFH